MWSRILEPKEREFLQVVAGNILAPLNVRIQISEEPTTIECFQGSGDHRTEWKEYRYHIFVFSEKGNIEFSDTFNPSAELVQLAWMIAYRAFKKLDGDMDGPISENLWPSDNGNLPDYKRFMPLRKES